MLRKCLTERALSRVSTIARVGRYILVVGDGFGGCLEALQPRMSWQVNGSPR